MSKTVSYKVIGRRSNPSDLESEIKYYAIPKSSGDISIREMAERVQESTTVTIADVIAVLTSLESVIVDSLKRGEIVRLAELGSLSIGMSSSGAASEELFLPSLIRGAHVRFRPGNALKSMLPTISFTKISAEKSSSEESQGSETGGE